MSPVFGTFARIPLKKIAFATVIGVFASGYAMAQALDDSIVFAPGDSIDVSFFARPDISGSLRIRSDGTVAFHQFGAVQAAGLTETQLQEALAARASEFFDTQTSVTVTAVSFRPIYVLGDVSNPGEFQYRFGLTALQAFALAGGAPTPTDDTAMLLRLETEKSNVIARRTRLRQVRESIARLETERAILVSPDAPTEAQLTELQSSILALKDELLETQLGQNDASRVSTIAAGELLEERLVILDARSAQLARALERVIELRERGIAPATRVEDSEANFSILQSSILETQSEAATNARAAESLEFDNAQILLQRKLDIEQQLVSSNNTAEVLEAQVAASVDFLARFGVVVPDDETSDVDSSSLRSWVVMRQPFGQDMQIVEADEHTVLMPGDTLQIKSVSR